MALSRKAIVKTITLGPPTVTTPDKPVTFDSIIVVVGDPSGTPMGSNGDVQFNDDIANAAKYSVGQAVTVSAT